MRVGLLVVGDLVGEAVCAVGKVGLRVGDHVAPVMVGAMVGTEVG